jgi:glycosyltransferase involved in cell wall biosynthesis
MALSQQSERFSIITCCYNAALYIREAIESALAQTHAALELIVVDDGSTDDTLEIVRSIRDPRLRVLEGAHGGVSRARNLGLEHATGDFVCFLDADDRWLPCKPEVRLSCSGASWPGQFSNWIRRAAFRSRSSRLPELAILHRLRRWAADGDPRRRSQPYPSASCPLGRSDRPVELSWGLRLAEVVVVRT